MKKPQPRTFSSWQEIRENSLGGSFYQISHQSASHAREDRGIKHLYPNHSTETFTTITPDDHKGREYLAREMLSNYDALEKHKEKITSFILEELSEGKATFSRRLAKEKKKQIDTLAELKDLSNSPLPHPPAMKDYMGFLLDSLLPDVWDKKEELLVRYWDESISEELPPLCVWSDNAIDSWICEKLGIKVENNGVQQIKDKRAKLQLLSMPFNIVNSHGEGIAGLHCKFPCSLNTRRLKTIIPRITINHLVGGAFELDRGAFRLQVLRCLKGWNPDVLSWIEKICAYPKTHKDWIRMLEEARNQGHSSPLTKT
jgi:hypothetical protein